MNPLTFHFTWLGGVGSSGVALYDSIGLPYSASGAGPGPRTGMLCAFWSGTMILFGGMNPQFKNDVWHYSYDSDTWRWMHGSSGGSSVAGAMASYGTLGVPSALALPFPREGAAGAMDSLGRFWIHGGNGYSSTDAFMNFNDLWYYTVESNQFCWMAGGSSQVAVSASLLSLQYGLPASDRNSFSRSYHAASIDSRAGKFYVFGGQNTEFDHSGLRDLWSYDLASKMWSWIGQ